MELLAGGEILDYFQKNPTDLNEKFLAVQFQKLFKALVHCHKQNIIHRDIKCQNIMFDSDGNIKLIDFGFAVQPDDKYKSQLDKLGTP